MVMTSSWGNTTRTGSEGTRFEWDGDPRLNIRPGDHRLIDPERAIYEFVGDFFDLHVRRSSIISTTAMAYRFDRYPSVRFSPSMCHGEDRLFKLTLGQHLERAAFSPKVCAHEGEGINTFDKSQWGSSGSIRLLSSCILRDIRLSPEQQAFVRGQLADSRRSLALSIPHLLRKGVPVDWEGDFATFREDPASAALFLPNVAGVVLGKLSGR